MALRSLRIEIVADEALSILNLWLVGLQNERVGGLNVVVDQVAWQDTALTLWKVEAWKLLRCLLACFGRSSCTTSPFSASSSSRLLLKLEYRSGTKELITNQVGTSILASRNQ